MASKAKAAAKVHPAVLAIQKSGAPKVKVAVSDIDGILRGKYLHRDKSRTDSSASQRCRNSYAIHA